MTILNETIVQIEVGQFINIHSPLFILCSIFACIGFIIFAILGIKEHLYATGCAIGVFVAIVILAVGLRISETPIYKEVPEYEVIINEDTLFYDILNNYDIIEQRDKIFVLRDKDWENND